MLPSALKSKHAKVNPKEAEDHIDLEYSDSSSENESSDEEVGEEIPSVDVKSLPTIAKDDATVARKLASAKKHKAVCWFIAIHLTAIITSLYL